MKSIAFMVELIGDVKISLQMHDVTSHPFGADTSMNKEIDDD
jgi:hypothetical protein